MDHFINFPSFPPFLHTNTKPMSTTARSPVACLAVDAPSKVHFTPLNQRHSHIKAPQSSLRRRRRMHPLSCCTLFCPSSTVAESISSLLASPSIYRAASIQTPTPSTSLISQPRFHSVCLTCLHVLSVTPPGKWQTLTLRRPCSRSSNTG